MERIKPTWRYCLADLRDLLDGIEKAERRPTLEEVQRIEILADVVIADGPGREPRQRRRRSRQRTGLCIIDGGVS